MQKTIKPLLIMAFIATVIGGWYWWSQPRIDFQAVTDKHIESGWITAAKKVNALEFLDGGGHYADIEPGSSVSLDQTVVRPLIERLQKDGQLEVVAVIDEAPDQASLMMAKLPAERERLLLIKRIVKEADDAYPGVILREYGYQWMHFFVLDVETSKATHAEDIADE